MMVDCDLTIIIIKKSNVLVLLVYNNKDKTIYEFLITNTVWLSN